MLEIDRVRSSRYESIYFDTQNLTSYRGAAHGRRHKVKVRTRTYRDSASCVLEVKTEGGREQTVKDRLVHSLEARDGLDAEARSFVRNRVNLRGADLHMSQLDGRSVRMDDHVLVETKSAIGAALVDRVLWRFGVRPVTISKYCVGLAALNPELPCNRWHRTLTRHFGRPAAGRLAD